MVKRNSILFLFLLLLIFASCKETVIEIPKPCTEEMEIPFTKFKLTMITDITSVCTLSVYNKSMVTGDGIILSRNGYSKNAKINGYICKDQQFYITVFYNDTTDNSDLKIEGILQYNWITGKLLYCQNYSNCTYIQIGHISGQYLGLSGRGFFYSPMFNGEFYCGPIFTD